MGLGWLERATRLAPADPLIRLTLAAHCLGRDDARALSLFTALAGEIDRPEAWFGLAVACLNRGQISEAAEAAARALQRFVIPAALVPTAARIATAAAATGWCAMTAWGTLAIHAPGPCVASVRLGASRPGRVRVDGGATFSLPAGWERTRQAEIRIGRAPVLGSPIALGTIARAEGCVAVQEGALSGWVWHPADPDRCPVLQVVAAGRSPAPARALRAVPEPPPAVDPGPLARAHGIRLDAVALAALGRGPLRVTGPDGLDLPGSPLDPFQPLGPQDPGRTARRFPARARVAHQSDGQAAVAIIVPVHDGGALVLDCLRSVQATAGADARLLVIDDASSDPALREALDCIGAAPHVRLIRHATPRGFVRSANAGLRTIAGADAVLLNSDTLPTPGWLARLRAGAYAARDIGIACPLSNNASLLSYPDKQGDNPMPTTPEADRLAALAWRANGSRVVDLPTAVGFCMYIRRECLETVGLFREDVFAQGYGEENDLSRRAAALGWRTVAVTGTFVAHRGGVSFGNARAALQRRNGALLAMLHPEYEGLVAAFRAADPLAPARRRLDRARFRQGSRRSGSVVLVTHDEQGGVEKEIEGRCRALAAEGVRPLVLRPHPGGARLAEGVENGFPNLHVALPAELGRLVRLLRAERPRAIEFHHMLGHAAALLALPSLLGVPYTIRLHDYAWICPRIVLIGGAERYCGEPDLASCEACIAANGGFLHEPIGVATLRARSAAFLRSAARIEAPSHDAAARLGQYVPGLAIDVRPPERAPRARALPPPEHPSVRVCVVGALGAAKGYAVLLAAARDAAARSLPLTFVVIGHTIGDAALIETGRVFLTGPYQPDEAVALIAAARADLALLPSVVPETWCHVLTEILQAGLRVVAFDLGAQAERIRADPGSGWLLSPALSPAALNDAVLAIAQQNRHEWRIYQQPPIASEPSFTSEPTARS